MTPDAVLALVGVLGGEAGRVLLVGCEPADVSPGMELSPPVAAAVDPPSGWFANSSRRSYMSVRRRPRPGRGR